MPELFHYHENLTETMEQGPSSNLKFSAEMQINQNEFLLLDIFSASIGRKLFWNKPDLHSHHFREDLLNTINTNKFKILLCGFGLVLL